MQTLKSDFKKVQAICKKKWSCPDDYAEALNVEANMPYWIRIWIAVRYKKEVR